MSGMAAMFEKNSESVCEPDFLQFAERVAHAKRLTGPTAATVGRNCRALKFNTPSSLHRNLNVDADTGSWLVAAGTVIDPKHATLDGDLSLLLKDYVAQGASVFQRLDGIFALVIYNAVTRSLVIVSDPFGFFSFFYGVRGNCTYLATSTLAIAQQIQATPSELGVQCFLRTGKVFGEMTLWQEVKRLRPATVLEFSEQGVRESTYWTPCVESSLARLTLPEAVDAAAQFLPSLLARNLRREGKLWTDLTGGFDTRFLDMLLERAGLAFKTNFVGPDEHPDVRVAKRISQRTGWEHEHFRLPHTWAQDAPHLLEEALERGDGHLNISLLLRPLWVHHREREQFSTLLNGLGGEMWRGPNWYPERFTIGESKTVHYERQLWSLMHPIPEEIMSINSKQVVQAELEQQFRSVGERYPDAPSSFKLDCVWNYRETAHAGAWSSCAAGLLRVIPAMFSKDIVSFAMSMDPRWRVRNSLVKHTFKKYKPVLSEIEIEGRGPAAPLGIDNWYRFIPSRLAYSRKAVDKFSQVAFGRSLWRTAHPEGYSRLRLRQEILAWAAARGMLNPDEMRSGTLYRADRLKSFLADAQTDVFKEDEFLGRVLTVEMALRTGSAVQAAPRALVRKPIT